MAAELKVRNNWDEAFWSNSLTAKLAIPVTTEIHFVNKVKILTVIVLGLVIVKIFGSVFDSY